MRGRRIYAVSTGFRSAPKLFTNALYALSFAGGPTRDKTRDPMLAAALWDGCEVEVWRADRGGHRSIRRLVLR